MRMHAAVIDRQVIYVGYYVVRVKYLKRNDKKPEWLSYIVTAFAESRNNIFISCNKTHINNIKQSERSYYQDGKHLQRCHITECK